ncbi:unnamed protein product [Caenorhabditis sp. 36 PRJEB53466]|nr:unnamed protein product [Caenorhabditis sp. 36 PRJEB53466]
MGDSDEEYLRAINNYLTTTLRVKSRHSSTEHFEPRYSAQMSPKKVPAINRNVALLSNGNPPKREETISTINSSTSSTCNSSPHQQSADHSRASRNGTGISQILNYGEEVTPETAAYLQPIGRRRMDFVSEISQPAPLPNPPQQHLQDQPQQSQSIEGAQLITYSREDMERVAQTRSRQENRENHNGFSGNDVPFIPLETVPVQTPAQRPERQSQRDRYPARSQSRRRFPIEEIPAADQSTWMDASIPATRPSNNFDLNANEPILASSTLVAEQISRTRSPQDYPNMFTALRQQIAQEERRDNFGQQPMHQPSQPAQQITQRLVQSVNRLQQPLQSAQLPSRPLQPPAPVEQQPIRVPQQPTIRLQQQPIRLQQYQMQGSRQSNPPNQQKQSIRHPMQQAPLPQRSNYPSQQQQPLRPPQQPPKPAYSQPTTKKPLSLSMATSTRPISPVEEIFPRPIPIVRDGEQAVFQRQPLVPMRRVQKPLEIPDASVNRNSIPTVQMPPISVNTRTDILPPIQSQLFRAIQNLPDLSDPDITDLWGVRHVRHQQRPGREAKPGVPLTVSPHPPRAPSILIRRENDIPEYQILQNQLETSCDFLRNLTPEQVDEFDEKQLQDIVEKFYDGTPREKFKQNYPFMVEGAIQKDSQIPNQLRVFSSRIGKVMIPDRPDRKNNDYVYFLVVKEGDYRGVSFDCHPRSLVSAKFPSEHRIVIRGYAILGQPVGKQTNRLSEGRWICFNDSLGLMHIVSGAARTSVKKQPVWDKRLDIVSISASFENNRFIVTHIVALTNNEEKKRQFPEEVFLVPDMTLQRTCVDEYYFYSTYLDVTVTMKKTLIGEIEIDPFREYEIVAVPTFPVSTRLDFRGIMLIDDMFFWSSKDRQWVYEKLQKRTEAYREDFLSSQQNHRSSRPQSSPRLPLTHFPPKTK